MNWLIICAENCDNENLKNKISEYSSESIVYETSYEKQDLLNIFQVLSNISACVIKTSENFIEDINKNTELLFIIGYLSGKNIPLFVDNNSLLESYSSFENIISFENTSLLDEYINNNYEKLYSDYLKKLSFNYLLKNGMPFTTDGFALNIINENQEFCECYLASGMDINSRDSEGTPMLNIATRYERVEIVKWLVSKGCDINAVSLDRGYTAIMDAVWKGNIELTKFFIENNAELNTLSKEGQTMLVLAVGADRLEICQLLANAGADPDIKDSMGMSAYAYAKLFKKQAILDVLEKYHKE